MKKKRIPKNVIITLVVIAIILASIALSINFISSGDRVSTSDYLESTAGGKVGIVIIPQQIEDKRLENGGS